MQAKRDKQCGVTAIELAVVLIVLVIMATLSASTFKSIIAIARRGEAKANLAHIDELQAVFKVAGGSAGSSFAYGTIPKANPVGYGGECSGNSAGWKNEIGFRPQACSELRYQYWSIPSGGSFTSVAYAASDTSTKRIFPGCDGAGASQYGKSKGDVLAMIPSSGIQVCRNIISYCPTGGNTSGSVNSNCGTPP